jgi:nicotinamide riboside kinase
MEKKGIKESRNIVITGPESSGKTTLFEQLKNLSGFSFIPEKSRTYLEKINRPYHYNDILQIAKQYVKELELLSQNKLSVISDTDLLTLQIWCEYKYKKCHPFIIENIKINPPDLYLICSPNIPWEFDPQRENPKDRIELYNIHLDKIKEMGVNFEIIEGDIPKRLIRSKKNITKSTILKLIYTFEKLNRGCCKRLRLYPFSVK